jgi:hypothetical protein
MLTMIFFNPIPAGFSLMEVIGGGGQGLDGKVDWGAETTESLDGRGTGSNMTEYAGDRVDGAPPMFLDKTGSNMTECAGSRVNRVPPMFLDSWMVINEILP